MKSKQEVIQEAWEQWGIPYSEKYVDANGFIAMKQDLPEIVYGALLDIRYSAEGHKDFDYKGGLYRPKSLQGIENNNGWTRIESESDLPKENMVFMECITKLGYQATHHFMIGDEKYMVEKYSHYKLMPFNPPIY